MARLPFISTEPSGIYHPLATANMDYPLALPDGAVGAILWFETSATNAAIIRGRVGVDRTNTAVGSITATSTNIGYHPAMPVEYELRPASSFSGGTLTRDTMYLHLSSSTAGAVVRGMWLYDVDR